MRVLLDTHTLLWWWTDSPRLSGTAREVIAGSENEVFVSAASIWEMRTKQRLGKLPLIPDLGVHVGDLLQKSRFTVLDIGWRHALAAGGYPADHRDPFDRMLAAQSALEALPLVTRDPVFSAFGNPCLW
ncbi:MAG: type II toxin-antitoxin system VapC family toxin [Gammaproteobacteria bacterium]|jgi:PIN domain nuclease of toxin-antitoxin system|nr:type II toxin-antitoxin system VapC family toxin [Actinomycetota bacterium]NBP54759.1 type II toxin-antitoxin system VapC family toxin [Actinomycetota bacterium]